MNKDTKSKVSTGARLGLFLMGVVWLIFTVVTIFRLADGKSYGYPMAGVIVAGLAFGNAFAFFISGWGLDRYPRFFVILSILLVAVNILLSFTDQVGFFDVATAVVDVVVLVLLLWLGRDLFFSKE
ncbi:MAG: hypothetical protein PVF83_01780 [Anaerolineales bacterium]